MNISDSDDPNKTNPDQISNITLKYCEPVYQTKAYLTLSNGTNFTNFIYYRGNDVESFSY